MELKDLTQCEKMLICWVFPVMQVYLKPRFVTCSHRGHIITLPPNVQNIAEILTLSAISSMCLLLDNVTKKKPYYFDTNLRTESSTKKIRVMVNTTTKRNLFTEKLKSKEPVKFMNLSVSRGSMTFFNTNSGSRLIKV